jgi:sugar lactone lactonase YvrE
MVRRITRIAVVVFGLAAVPADADTLPMVTSFGGAGQATGRFVNLVDVTVAPDGSVYTIENGGGVADRVQRFDANGTFLGTTGSEGNAPGQFQQAWSVAVGGDGVVYALDTFEDRVTRFSADLKTLIGTWGNSGFGAGQFRNPEGITVNGTDVVFIADRGNNQVDRYTSAGAPVVSWGSLGSANDQFNRPIEVTTDSIGDVYVADRDNHAVKRFTATGTFVRSYGLGQGVGPGQFETPNDVAVDRAGNVWISDLSNFNVQEFNSTGGFIASFNRVGTGAGQTFRPEGLSFNSSGDLYIADASGSRIVRTRPGAQGGAAVPPPVAGKTGDAAVVSGTVLVRVPSTGTFVKLTSATEIPVGSQLDTKRGTLKLTVALRKAGGTASAQLSGGRFLFGQKTGSGKLRTDLALKGGSFKGCPAPGKGGSARRRTIRFLKAKATGKFNVIGRHSSGVERGTTWTTKDTCDATTTSVKAGSVAVRDFAKRKTIVVRAGHTYTARARRG